jgi:hypothetical protein
MSVASFGGTCKRRAIAAFGTRANAKPSTALLAAAWLVVTLAGCRHPPEADARPAQLAQMHEACVSAMVRDACQAVIGSAPEVAADTVLIAGVGRIDARAYRELRDAGDAMCGVARDACNRDWDGPSCRSARALWATAQQVASR